MSPISEKPVWPLLNFNTVVHSWFNNYLRARYKSPQINRKSPKTWDLFTTFSRDGQHFQWLVIQQHLAQWLTKASTCQNCSKTPRINHLNEGLPNEIHKSILFMTIWQNCDVSYHEWVKGMDCFTVNWTQYLHSKTALMHEKEALWTFVNLGANVSGYNSAARVSKSHVYL